jgi:proteasome assembly chaperone (PAC2) family protein
MDAIRWEQRPGDLRAPVTLAAFRGWNDAASAASSALGYIADRLGAERLAVVDPEEFFDFQATRPHTDLTDPEHHTLTWPEVEIHVARGRDRDLLLVSGHEPSMRWRTFTELLLDAAAGLGSTMFVTLGAFLADVPHTRPVRLTGMARPEELIQGMNLREPAYRGPTGIVGVMHQIATAREVPAVSLWVPASHYAAGVTNAKAALALVRAVTAVTRERVNDAELESAAAGYELQITRAVEADPKLARLVHQLEDASAEDAPFDQGAMPSADELATELERFLREYGDGPQ